MLMFLRYFSCISYMNDLYLIYENFPFIEE